MNQVRNMGILGSEAILVCITKAISSMFLKVSRRPKEPYTEKGNQRNTMKIFDAARWMLQFFLIYKVSQV